MRRFPSGTTDQYIYFVAVDSTDLITRETGLTTFTVYRSRNGAAAAAYTTPTVAEVSSANMPGVYSLLLDEDMTIGSGNTSEEVVLHITQASMAPVTLIFELYRPLVTEGETLTVASGIADADVERWLGQAVAAVTVNGVPEVDVTHWRGTAAAAPTVAGVPAVEVIDIAAAGQTDIRSAVGLATANLDTQLTTIDDFLDTEVAAIKAKTDLIPAAPAAVGDIPSAATIADAVWDEDATAHQTQGTFGQAIGDPAADTDSIWALVNTNLDAAVSTRLASASYTAPLDAAGTRAAVGLASANLDTQIATLATAAALTIVDDFLDTEVAAIKAKTDSLTFTVAGQVDANIQYVNDVQVNGTGAAGNEWGP